MFKVGDRVTGLPGNGYSFTNDKAVMEVKEIINESGMVVKILDHSKNSSEIGNEYTVIMNYFKLINPAESGTKNNIMSNIKEKFILALTKEPQKSFRKAGITNGDDILTDDGAKIFLTWLLNKNAEIFKSEVVDDLLKEEKSA